MVDLYSLMLMAIVTLFTVPTRTHQLGLPADGISPGCDSDTPKPPRRELPAQTEYWKAKLIERPDGLRVWVGSQGEEFINVGVFGETLKYLKAGEVLSARQSASIRWLEANMEALNGGGAVTWRSNYATNYSDQVFTPPWSGGFGQASIIAGLLALHTSNGEAKWLQLALRAGLAFGVPTVAGGFCERLPNGSLFFEELTSPEVAAAGRSPHIINGHIWATLQLVRLAKATGDPRIAELANEGERTIKATMSMFDNGTWIRYDLSPWLYDIRFCLTFEPHVLPPTPLASGPLVAKIELLHVDPRYKPVELCIGVAGDDAGAWRLGDGRWGWEFGVVPWGDQETAGEMRGRRIRPGKSVFVMEYPAGAEADYFHEPLLRLRVWYVDDGSDRGTLNAMVFSMREQVNNEYAEIPGIYHELLCDGKVRCLEKSIRICDLGKSSMSLWKIESAYIAPLEQLRVETGDAFYGEWVERLKRQVASLRAAYPALKF